MMKGLLTRIRGLWMRFLVKMRRRFGRRRERVTVVPSWGGGRMCQVLRHICRGGVYVRHRSIARIHKVNQKTVWVRFFDGGFGKFRKARVS